MSAYSGRPAKGQSVHRTYHVRLKDDPDPLGVPLAVSMMVPEGREVEIIGLERGDATWNNGQGYVILKLSVTRTEVKPA